MPPEQQVAGSNPARRTKPLNVNALNRRSVVSKHAGFSREFDRSKMEALDKYRFICARERMPLKQMVGRLICGRPSAILCGHEIYVQDKGAMMLNELRN